jgi:hypothetical protein
MLFFTIPQVILLMQFSNLFFSVISFDRKKNGNIKVIAIENKSKKFFFNFQIIAEVNRFRNYQKLLRGHYFVYYDFIFFLIKKNEIKYRLS